MTELEKLLEKLSDPRQEVQLIRKGVRPRVFEELLSTNINLPLKEILKRLSISSTTYFLKKRHNQLLSSGDTEKLIRLLTVRKKATEILGEEGREWLYRKIPSLGDEAPIDLLDTEAGHKLIEQALLQIKYGIYG